MYDKEDNKKVLTQVLAATGELYEYKLKFNNAIGHPELQDELRSHYGILINNRKEGTQRIDLNATSIVEDQSISNKFPEKKVISPKNRQKNLSEYEPHAPSSYIIRKLSPKTLKEYEPHSPSSINSPDPFIIPKKIIL